MRYLKGHEERKQSRRYCGMPGEDPDYVHKLVFLGDTEVGKTSLVQRYVYDSFSPDGLDIRDASTGNSLL